jgi:putative hydrolase of the HAD superfamily
VFEVHTLIFDLDNCLCSARAVGESCFSPAFAAIRAAAPSGFAPTQLRRVFRDCWTHDFEAVCTKHALTVEMRQAGFAAFADAEVRKPIEGYGDLPRLAALPGRKFLVSSGFTRLQTSKVRALGLAGVFERVVIDAIDSPPRKGKQHIFEELLSAVGVSAGEAWVIGDNAESELAAGRHLGCRTVQTLRPGVVVDPHAQHHVRGLRELRTLLTAAAVAAV